MQRDTVFIKGWGGELTCVKFVKMRTIYYSNRTICAEIDNLSGNIVIYLMRNGYSFVEM